MSAARDQRTRELAAIHVAKKQLGLDDDTYRAMLWTLERVSSAADLDHAGRQRVLEHLRSRGFARSPSAPARSTDHGRKPHVAPDRQPLIDKLEALLAGAGRPWNYVRAIAERRMKLQLEWCSADQLRRLVAMLEYDKARRMKRTSS